VLASILIAGALGAISASFQVHTRLSGLRPLSSGSKAKWLFVSIVVLSAVVSAAIASVQFLPAGGSITSVALGVGTSVPISGGLRSRSRREEGGESGGSNSALVQHLGQILEMIGSLANKLQDMLAGAKLLKVAEVVHEIRVLTHSGTYPAQEHITNALESLIEDSTAKNKSALAGRLRAISNAGDPLTPLIRLAYEMGQEEVILQLVRGHTSEGPTPPATPS
jgi:hypothetical protein